MLVVVACSFLLCVVCCLFSLVGCWLLAVVVCCVVIVVRCLLRVADWFVSSLFVVVVLLFVVPFVVVRCSLFVDCCLLFVVHGCAVCLVCCCRLFRCSLLVACCRCHLLVDAGCLLFV